ncbi:hypothetical protein BJ944DRAFT_63862 [Cunninghamella echinulata]|nr:hypothetical protein BJ944DRAFT_63862 [Cunninghamella echinulata]
MSELSCIFFKDAVSYINISYRLLDSSEIKSHSYIVRPEVTVTLDNQIIISPSIKEAKEDVMNKNKPQQHQDGYIITFILKPLVDIELECFEIKYLVDFSNLKMIANGYQSWSQTGELHKDDMIGTIRKSIVWCAQHIFQRGDAIFNGSSEKGHIQSSGYTHFRDINNNIIYLGSLSEHHGYTYFKADFNSSTFEIYKDIKGKRVIANESLHLVKIWTCHGNNAEKLLWDTYITYIEDRRAIENNEKVYHHANG